MPSITVREARDIILSKLKPLPAETGPVAHALSRILSAQSPDVDAVSEATSSSHGIMDAVRQALASA